MGLHRTHMVITPHDGIPSTTEGHPTTRRSCQTTRQEQPTLVQGHPETIGQGKFCCLGHSKGQATCQGPPSSSQPALPWTQTSIQALPLRQSCPTGPELLGRQVPQWKVPHQASAPGHSGHKRIGNRLGGNLGPTQHLRHLSRELPLHVNLKEMIAVSKALAH